VNWMSLKETNIKAALKSLISDNYHITVYKHKFHS